MLEIKKRTTPINLNDNEQAEINRLLFTYCGTHNIEFTSLKEVLFHLLRQAEQAPVERPANLVELSANQSVFTSDDLLSARVKEFLSTAGTVSVDITPEIILSKSFDQLNDLRIDNASLRGRNSLLSAEIDELKREGPEIEFEQPEEPAQPEPSNTISFEVSHNESIVIDAIRQNRNAHFNSDRTGSETVKDVFFNRATLGNWSGYCFTGITAPK